MRKLLIKTEEELLGMFLSDTNDRSNPGPRKSIKQEAQLLTKQAFIGLWDLKPESYKVQPREKNQEKQLENSANRKSNPFTQQNDNYNNNNKIILDIYIQYILYTYIIYIYIYIYYI